MHLYGGLAVGGEFFISPHFSLGGEAQLNYIAFSDPEVNPTPSSTQSRTNKIVTNNALMFFRWYF
jgi:hypothetical protein